MLLTTELSQEKVCFHPFCFLTFPWPPNLLSTAAPKSHQVLAHSLQSPGLWAFDPVSLPFSGHNVTCFFSLSPFLPGQLHKAHPSAHSPSAVRPILGLFLTQHGSQISLSCPDLYCERQTCLSSCLVGSFTCIFISMCPEPTLLTFHPEVPPPLFSC